MDNIFREANPNIRFHWGANRDFPPHIHEDIELICLEQGTLRAQIDGKTYQLHRGSIFLACPNQVHSYADSSDDLDCAVVIINPAILGDIGKFMSENTPIIPLLESDCEDDLWNLLRIAYKEHIAGNPEVVIGLMIAIFNKLRKEIVFDKSELVSQNISRMLQYCLSHYKENISVERVAKALFLSRSCISHTFNQQLNVSFSDYINSLRSAEAARLLETGAYTAGEIVEKSGFPSIRTFNRAFQNRYGMSPSEYKQKSRIRTKAKAKNI